MKNGIVVAVINNKGGVGKTTVTTNLAHAITRKRKKVLVVDLDSQCNASNTLLSKSEEIRNTLYELFSEDKINPNSCIYSTPYENLFCLPNIANTSALEPSLLQSLPNNFKLLRSKLKKTTLTNYDFTFIDCPPNMGYFVITALHLANFVIVPIWAGSKFSIEGLRKAINLITDIKQSGNKNLKFLKLLINQVDRRTIMSKFTIEKLRSHFPENDIFKTMIPSNAAFQKAEEDDSTIIRYDPTVPGAKAFRALAKEFLNFFQQKSFRLK